VNSVLESLTSGPELESSQDPEPSHQNRSGAKHGASLCPRCAADAVLDVRRGMGQARHHLSLQAARSSFRLIWPSSGSSGKTCLVRAHLLPVVVERFRRGAKRRGAQAAAQGLALNCQVGFDLFADHSLRFCSGGLAANCQLHGAKPNNRGSFKSQ
jgi:hypothetical protein